MANGLLDTVPPPQPATATGYSPEKYEATPYQSTGYKATPYEVPKDGLVQQRVLDIVAKDSPLMQQARTRALQAMGSRGLINSSLAVQAGQEGVISQALPMATPDAASITNAAMKTGDAKNTADQFEAAAKNAALTNTANQQNAASQFNAGSTNAASQFTAGATNAASQANLQAQNQAFVTSLNNQAQLAGVKLTTENQMAIAQLDTATRIQLTNIDNQNRQLLQGSQSANAAYVQAATNIANISANASLSRKAKDDAIATQINMLQHQLGVIGSIASVAPGALDSLKDIVKEVWDVVPAGRGIGGGGTGGTAAPIQGTNPLTSVWSDGEKHTPPQPGYALEVPGNGWWGSDGKFYPSQVEAINRQRTADPTAPVPRFEATTPPPNGGAIRVTRGGVTGYMGADGKFYPTEAEARNARRVGGGTPTPVTRPQTIAEQVRTWRPGKQVPTGYVVGARGLEPMIGGR